MFSVKFKAEPVSVSQISTYNRHKAENAIDGNLNTKSYTQCAWNTELWYKMKFDAVYCFTEVIVVQSDWNNAERKDDTRMLIINTGSKTESLCGVLKVNDVLTIEGQTYRIPCDLKCGDEVKLTVRHDSGKYHKDACIHMKEIEAFHTGLY